jgi:hypothetical protein
VRVATGQLPRQREVPADQLLARIAVTQPLPAIEELGVLYLPWGSSTKISNDRGGSNTIWLW